jgi:hypothetical protein
MLSQEAAIVFFLIFDLFLFFRINSFCILISSSRGAGLLDAHQVAHLSAVSLRQPQFHSATSNCVCAQSSIEALTTPETALRSEVRLLGTDHTVKVETLVSY